MGTVGRCALGPARVMTHDSGMCGSKAHGVNLG